jgi:hypothetical protein
MGRGQNSTRPANDPSEGWTKQELLDAVSEAPGDHEPLSGKTFDLIRKAARVPGPGHGGLTWVFSPEDVVALVKRAESGGFTERGVPAARAWRGLLAERGVAIDEPRRPRTRFSS